MGSLENRLTDLRRKKDGQDLQEKSKYDQKIAKATEERFEGEQIKQQRLDELEATANEKFRPILEIVKSSWLDNEGEILLIKPVLRGSGVPLDNEDPWVSISLVWNRRDDGLVAEGKHLVMRVDSELNLQVFGQAYQRKTMYSGNYLHSSWKENSSWKKKGDKWETHPWETHLNNDNWEDEVENRIIELLEARDKNLQFSIGYSRMDYSE